MKKEFVVSAVLYPLLIIALTLIMGVISMSDNRRKILDNMKLEVSEESETDPEMTNSSLYYKIKVLEEAYAELNSRFSEEYFDEVKNQAKLETFPVGSIYTSTTSTNPSSYIGGTWEAYGSGRTLVGVDTNQSEFNAVNKTGGSKAYTPTGKVGDTSLSISQIPSHTHSIPALSGTAASAGSHTHMYRPIRSVDTDYYLLSKTGNSFFYWGFPEMSTSASGDHQHSITTNASLTESTGSSSSHTHNFTGVSTSSIQPYITVYFWKRIA